MSKLRDNRGETLIESLVSVLIAVLAFAVLATSVVTAEKIEDVLKAALSRMPEAKAEATA